LIHLPDEDTTASVAVVIVSPPSLPPHPNLPYQNAQLIHLPDDDTTASVAVVIVSPPSLPPHPNLPYHQTKLIHLPDDDTTASVAVVIVSPPSLPTQAFPPARPHLPTGRRPDGLFTTVTVVTTIAVVTHTTIPGLMIFAQRKRIGLVFSLLRRKLTLTLLYAVDLLFRYVTDVACPSDSITFREGRNMLCPRGCIIFAIWNSSLFLFLSAALCYTHEGVILLQFGILIYFIPFGLLNFFSEYFRPFF
jgi:hypothetical protein